MPSETNSLGKESRPWRKKGKRARTNCMSSTRGLRVTSRKKGRGGRKTGRRRQNGWTR